MSLDSDVGAKASAELAEQELCPHCGGRTHLEPSDDYRWICAACGGPRVPVKADSERYLRELRAADQSRKMAFAWRMAAIGLFLVGTLVGALGAALAVVSVFLSLAMALLATGFFAVGVVASSRSRGARERAKRSTFEAWESALESLLRAHGGNLTAKELADELKTSEEDVERMMSFLSVDARARVEVKDAEIVYFAPEDDDHDSAARASSADQRRG